MPRSPTGTYWLSANAVIGIYAKKSGVWSRITTRTVTVSGEYTDASQKTLSWTLDETFQLGTGVQMFGVAIEGVVGYNNPTAVITDLSSVSWQALSTSGQTSATPDGQATTVTIRPQ